MIAPSFRQSGTTHATFGQAIKGYLSDQKKGNQLEFVLQELTSAKNNSDSIINLVGVGSFADKGIPSLIDHYKNCKMLQSAVQFGSAKSQVKCQFKWTDMLSKQNRTSYSPKFQYLSVLYNIATAFMHAGNTCELSLLQGLKDASKFYQKAAWTYDYLAQKVIELSPSEQSSSFSPQNLQFWRTVALAQAQACFFKVAESKSMKSETLVKIAKQASDYYQQAYTLSTGPPLNKLLEPAKVINVARFQHIIYLSKAFYQKFKMELQVAKSKGQGYGLVVAYIQKAIEELQTYKTVRRNFEKFQLFVTQFQKNLTQQLVMRGQAQLSGISMKGDQIQKLNKKVYCELVPNTSSIQAMKLPSQSFVKPLSIEQQLQAKSGLSQQFKSIHPPEVLNLLDAYRKYILSIIQQELIKVSHQQAQLQSIMSAHGLPHSLLTFQTADVPQSLWLEISRIQQSGNGVDNLQSQFEKVKFLQQSAIQTLNTCDNMIQQDASQQQDCRKQYGSKWNRTPTDVAAGNYVMNLSQHRAKLEQSAKVNDDSSALMQKNKQYLDLLRLQRQQIQSELENLSGGQGILAENPAIKNVSDVIEQSQKLLKQRQEQAQQLEKELSNQEIVPDLVDVINKKKDQGQTMDMWKNKFAVKAQGISNELISRYMALSMQLKESVGAFEKEKSQAMNNNPKMKFIEKLSNGVKEFGSLSHRIRQGLNFYQQIVSNINSIYQDIAAFRAQRIAQKSQLISQLSTPTSGYAYPPPQQPQAGGYPPSYPSGPKPMSGYVYQPNPYQFQPNPYGGQPSAYPGFQQGYPPHQPPK